MPFYVDLYQYAFGDYEGHRETGRDDERARADLVLYLGERKEFDLTKINKAVVGFAFALGDTFPDYSRRRAVGVEWERPNQCRWESLIIKAMSRPASNPRNL